MKYKTTRYIIFLCLILVLAYLVDLGELWKCLSQLTLEIAGYLGLLSVLLIYISALKWKIFLEAFEAAGSVIRLFNLYLVGYFVNLLVPSYVGGDLVRSWYIGKKVGQHEALTATILERYTGFVAMLTLALIFMWTVELVTIEVKIAVLLVALGLVVITLLALSDNLLSSTEKFFLRFNALQKVSGVFSHIRKIQAGLQMARDDKKLLCKTMILSFMFHSFTVLNVVAAAYAVGWFHPPAWDIFVVLPLILLIGSLPVAPSGLGIQEGAYLYFLHGIGATSAQALGVGIILRAKAYVLALVGGLIWLSMKKERVTED